MQSTGARKVSPKINRRYGTSRKLRLARDSSGNFYLVGSAGATYSDGVIDKLDPYGTLIWSRSLGGGGGDYCTAATVDGEGNVLVAGYTNSPDFPTLNAFDSFFEGYREAFAAKLASSNGAILWSTFIGGELDDFAESIAVDPSGNAVVLGWTNSEHFPAVGGFRSSLSGDSDLFVVKLRSDGALEWSSYYGGSSTESGLDNWSNVPELYDMDVATDPSGNIYITGGTYSADAASSGSFNSVYRGGGDALLAKFGPNGQRLWATYLGGIGIDIGCGVACDPSGNVLVTGQTKSSNFPVQNAFDPTYNGEYDLFLSKFTPDDRLIWSTYLGGSKDEYVQDIAVDQMGNAYLDGQSLDSDLATSNAFYVIPPGSSYQPLVAMFSATGNRLWLSYVGNDVYYDAVGPVTDDEGSVYMAGRTGPDLFVTRIEGLVKPSLLLSQTQFQTDSFVHPGQSISVGALVDNVGVRDAPPFWVEVWGSKTGGLTLDRMLTRSLYVGGLPAGGSLSWAENVPLLGLPDGAYTVLFVTDRLNQVEEISEHDNYYVRPSPRAVVLRPPTRADLTVQGFAMTPDSARAGQEIHFSGQVANRGSEPSGPFWIEFWGSRDWPYPSLDFFLCDSIPVAAGLQPGQSIDLSGFARVLYSVPTGIFMVGCVVDRDDAINELDETNNYQFEDFQILNGGPARPERPAHSGAPDIQVQSADFSASTSPLAPGDPVSFRVAVANIGDADTGPFWLEYWGSRDGGITLSNFLAVSDSIANLPPGRIAPLEPSKPLAAIPDGPYSVVVAADRPRNVAESNEANNRFAIPGKRIVVLRPQTGANLVFATEREGVTLLSESWNLFVRGSIRNTGSADSGPFWIEFWACPGDPVRPSLDFMICPSIHVPNVPAGGSVYLWGAKRPLYNWVPPGQYTIVLFADRPEEVIETNETDNYIVLRKFSIPLF
jgi:hypothetical protein